MISSLRGKIISFKQGEILLDVAGVGYQIYISKNAAEQLKDNASEITIITHLDVKENSLTLFGFSDEKEKQLFKLLTTVSGIGAKAAHNILSNASYRDVIGIITGFSGLSVKIPGVGPKKLELISTTLRDKIYKLPAESDSFESKVQLSADSSRAEALGALMNLGYQRSEAEKLIREVLKNDNESDLKTEDIIKRALKYI